MGRRTGRMTARAGRTAMRSQATAATIDRQAAAAAASRAAYFDDLVERLHRFGEVGGVDLRRAGSPGRDA